MFHSALLCSYHQASRLYFCISRSSALCATLTREFNALASFAEDYLPRHFGTGGMLWGASRIVFRLVLLIPAAEVPYPFLATSNRSLPFLMPAQRRLSHAIPITSTSALRLPSSLSIMGHLIFQCELRLSPDFC